MTEQSQSYGQTFHVLPNPFPPFYLVIVPPDSLRVHNATRASRAEERAHRARD